jgi:hypothetical protein
MKDQVAGGNHGPVFGRRYPGVGVAVERISFQRAIVTDLWTQFDLGRPRSARAAEAFRNESGRRPDFDAVAAVSGC